MEINYTKGDATLPTGEGKKLIVHICNDLGGWGKGFVMAISRRWKEPEKQYRAWAKSGENFTLGEVQFVEVEPNLAVANMIAQAGIYKKNGIPPIRYEALQTTLSKVADFCQTSNYSAHMPRIGAGLAGGDWAVIEGIIKDTLVDEGVEVTVYDFEP
jgi:O-acetyl-ADP-ribose deacetylase (regulator of RNase III)